MPYCDTVRIIQDIDNTFNGNDDESEKQATASMLEELSSRQDEDVKVNVIEPEAE